MRFQVTQEHIDRGIRGMACRCPVSLSLQGTGFILAAVGVSHILNVGSSNGIRIPYDVLQWIKRFDEQGEGEPFTFELPVELPA
jgi:hypothetical protein